MTESETDADVSKDESHEEEKTARKKQKEQGKSSITTNTGNKKLKPCSQCSYTTTDTSNLHKHFRNIHEKIRSLECPQCDYRATERNNLTAHIRHIHTKEKPHKCSRCDYACAMKTGLRNHFLRLHVDAKAFRCDRCDYDSHFEKEFSEHVRGVHENVFDHKCDVIGCDFSTHRPSLLTSHLKRFHLGIKKEPWKCKQCDFITWRRWQLNVHVKQIHEKVVLEDWQCDECDYKTANRDLFRRHARVKHDQRTTTTKFIAKVKRPDKQKKEPVILDCPFCDYKTKARSSMRSHDKMHLRRFEKDSEMSKVREEQRLENERINRESLWVDLDGGRIRRRIRIVKPEDEEVTFQVDSEDEEIAINNTLVEKKKEDGPLKLVAIDSEMVVTTKEISASSELDDVEATSNIDKVDPEILEEVDKNPKIVASKKRKIQNGRSKFISRRSPLLKTSGQVEKKRLTSFSSSCRCRKIGHVFLTCPECHRKNGIGGGQRMEKERERIEDVILELAVKEED